MPGPTCRWNRAACAWWMRRARSCAKPRWRASRTESIKNRGVYSVHVRTRKFRNPEKTKRYVVPAPRANSKTQGGTRIDSDSICHRCHRHQSVFFGFSDGLSIDAVGGCPLFVDFDEDGGDKSQQGCLVGKDANLAGAAFDLLLDGALDRIGCAQAAAVLVWKAEHGEPFGHGAVQPGCQLGCAALVGLHEPVQLFLGAHQGGGIPDAAEFSADGFADGGTGRVMDGVLSQMKLAALPL